MTKRLLYIWFTCIIAAAASLVGCSDDTFRDDILQKEEPAGDVYIRFRMSFGNNGIPDVTRADEESPTETIDSLTPGTDREKAINTIDLLVYDVEKGKLADIVSLKKETITEITEYDGAVIPIYAHLNQKLHIYAIANMTERMRSELRLNNSGENVSAASSRSEYWDVMNEFVPGSDGKQENLETNGGCIPMTGQFVTEDAAGSTDIIIRKENLSSGNPLKIKATVSRIVAKVHLLAKAQNFPVTNPETGEQVEIPFVIAKDYSDTQKGGNTSGENANWLGWMRLSTVRYIINGTNKSTYLFPQTQTTADGKTVLKDLNMDLEAYRYDKTFDESLWRRDFNFYDAISLHSANISNTKYFGNAEAYDDTKLQNTAKGGADYSKGLYCLENYFDIPANKDFYSGQKNAIPSVTHLSIATRLMPRRLAVLTDFPKRLDDFFKEADNWNYSAEFYNKYNITENDLDRKDAEHWVKMKEKYFTGKADNPKEAEVYRDDFYIVTTDNESDAVSLINWSLIARGLWTGDDTDFENGKFPKYTYYVYDTKYDEASGVANGGYSLRYVYLVAGAVALAKDKNIRIKNYSVPHIGGWGYYYTYIDNSGSGTTNGVTSFTASQVTRNNYYIITVNNFGTPGGTITEPEYIKVNTLSVGWDYSGKGEINLH